MGGAIRWAIGGARHSAQRPAPTVDPKLHQAILDTEQLLKDDELTSHVLMGDEIKLDCYDDGYPKLPDGLDRSPEPLFAQAA